jgi:DNA-directed RNA polymerase specialized sigma24 family protein
MVPFLGTFFWAVRYRVLTHHPGRRIVSRSQLVARHLPFLRRYARALTGSQASGDAYVTAVLEAILEDPSNLPDEREARTGLYRTFTKIWNSVPVNGATDPAEDQLPAEARISRLTPLPRQAFLLISLEGFTEEEAAAILDVDVPALRKMLDDAGQELAGEIATDVLIIEDEPLIAMDIEGLVERLGHNVLGVARTHNEAVKLAKGKRPGLILADIQLADGSSGLDAVNELLQTFNVPVIFITAYPERFLTGERPEPAFLIPKPYQPATVSAVISQALFFERNAQKPQARATA